MKLIKIILLCFMLYVQKKEKWKTKHEEEKQMC